MVDISNLKAGDRVKFRNNESDCIHAIEGITKEQQKGYRRTVDFSSGLRGQFDNNGMLLGGILCPNDIVEIIPKKSKVARRLAKIVDGLPLCETRKIEGVTVKLRDHSVWNMTEVFRPFAHRIDITLNNHEMNKLAYHSFDEDGKHLCDSEHDIVRINFAPPIEKSVSEKLNELRELESMSGVRLQLKLQDGSIYDILSFQQDPHRFRFNLMDVHGSTKYANYSSNGVSLYTVPNNPDIVDVIIKKETPLNKASERAAEKVNMNPSDAMHQNAIDSIDEINGVGVGIRHDLDAGVIGVNNHDYAQTKLCEAALLSHDIKLTTEELDKVVEQVYKNAESKTCVAVQEIIDAARKVTSTADADTNSSKSFDDVATENSKALKRDIEAMLYNLFDDFNRVKDVEADKRFEALVEFQTGEKLKCSDMTIRRKDIDIFCLRLHGVNVRPFWCEFTSDGLPSDGRAGTIVNIETRNRDTGLFGEDIKADRIEKPVVRITAPIFFSHGKRSVAGNAAKVTEEPVFNFFPVKNGKVNLDDFRVEFERKADAEANSGKPSEENPMTDEQIAKSAAGVRYTGNKPRYDLISPEALEGMAQVLALGAKKYAARNWEKGMKWSEEVIRPLFSHIQAFMSGEEIDGQGMTDEERKEKGKSGLPHTAHILCNALFLHTYYMRGIGIDDRGIEPKKPVDRRKGNA